MTPNDDKLSYLQERIAVNEKATSAAHTRIDKMDEVMRGEIKGIREEIKESIKPIADDVKLLIGFMERWKGMVAVIIMVSGILAWAFQQATSFFLRNH